MTCKCCGKDDCKLIDKCCGKRKKKENRLSEAVTHRPTERIIERKIVELAAKCPPDCNCGGHDGRVENQ